MNSQCGIDHLQCGTISRIFNAYNSREKIKTASKKLQKNVSILNLK